MNRAIKLILPALILVIVILLPTNPNTENKNQKTEAEQIILEAHSALAFNLLTNKILFEKNIYEPLPLASLSKIISSLVVADHIDLNEYIEITKNAVQTPEPSTLLVGEHLRAEDLLAMAMGESSNDAMMALVEHFGNKEWPATSSVEWFLELINKKAFELGTEKMSFLNPTGLDIENETFPSNFGSAWDLAQIVKNSIDSPIWQLGEKKEVISREGIAHKIHHTNLLRNEISGINGAKTGFTDSAGGNLILIVEKPLGAPKLIIILGSSLEGRFLDAKKLFTTLAVL